ncbi:response regulator [Candidatus Poribacteria bacterium]|nr:response regulator [Candidatus Poribacteria bacterium]
MARILVIEDNYDNLELMTYLLNAFGHTLFSAHDGEEGLAVACRETLDLIICDVQLPGIDGYEVARQLKTHPVLHSIPLVAVTAFAMVGDRDKVLAAGFDEYISKPIAPETFVGQVDGFLQPGQRSTPQQPDAPALTAWPQPHPDKHTAILVLDNSYVNIDLLRSTLEPFGYAIISANSVREGLALARQTPPDLILSDVHLPGENGYDFIKSVKADPQLRHIPFVFLSSTIWRESDLSTGLSLGATKFIFRPIEPQALVAEIEAYLQEQRKEK